MESGWLEPDLVRGKGGEGLEAPSLAAHFRPCYFGEGGRVTLPNSILWQILVRGKGREGGPSAPCAVRGWGRVPHPLTSPSERKGCTLVAFLVLFASSYITWFIV